MLFEQAAHKCVQLPLVCFLVLENDLNIGSFLPFRFGNHFKECLYRLKEKIG